MGVISGLRPVSSGAEAIFLDGTGGIWGRFFAHRR